MSTPRKPDLFTLDLIISKLLHEAMAAKRTFGTTEHPDAFSIVSVEGSYAGNTVTCDINLQVHRGPDAGKITSFSICGDMDTLDIYGAQHDDGEDEDYDGYDTGDEITGMEAGGFG